MINHKMRQYRHWFNNDKIYETYLQYKKEAQKTLAAIINVRNVEIDDSYDCDYSSHDDSNKVKVQVIYIFHHKIATS